MSSARASTAGSTRACPHCKATILQSAAVCPNCRGHLRYDSAAVAGQSTAASTPLRVEGTVRHPGGTGALEYTMLLTIRNQRGEEVARQLVGVGAMHAGEQRTFTLSVELFDGKPSTLARK
ncbi:MAG: hypothetical protein DI635_06675 [Pseudoxanthomonas suwonensis]|nr:MAG: hypothetical protein DI635_06675 [Pseudoxanthomonas suwonensis]